MGYKYVLFDLDGTLTDSEPGIANSVKYALGKMNREVGDASVLKRFVGPPLKESFAKYYHMNEEEVAAAVSFYRERYSEKGLFENSVYTGIEELVKYLYDEGRVLILATAKPEKFAVRIMEHFNLARYFTGMVGTLPDGDRDSKTQVIQYIIGEYRLTDKSEVVMVGDREHDVKGAHNCGIECIGILYGYGSEQELREAGAEYIARDCEDIKSIITGHARDL